MKNGKISESVLKRSVLKQLHTTSDRILFKPAVGEDCAVISMQAGGQTKLVTATQTFTLDVLDKHVRANCAVYDALNNIYAMGARSYWDRAGTACTYHRKRSRASRDGESD